MKFTNLVIFLIIASAMLVKAQDNLPPEHAKMFFRGANFHSWFEMTLTREGGKLSGNYFYVKSGRTNSLKVRGSMAADGKFVLREFDRANKQTGEFQGVLSENTEDFGINIRGTWTNRSGKFLQFDADGQIINFTGKRRIDTHWIFENNRVKRFQLKAVYPEIVGGRADDWSEFNRAVKLLTVGTVADFRKQMFRQTAAQIKNLRSAGNNFNADYAVKYADDDLISLQFIYSEYSDGMVHALYGSQSLTFDVNNADKLSLSDLFTPGAKYHETISAYCVKELQSRAPVNNQKLAADDWADGASPAAENYESWNLTRKGLLITFGVEQIAAYSAGVNYVLIPYSKLKGIAKPGGAMETIMKKENL